MEREERYMVFKLSDLTETQAIELERLKWKHDARRNARGKSPLKCVVVEHDWPEYETVWSSIEARTP